MQSVNIKNFKSYEQQLVHGLNPHINVIIGSNGQGKSNFFKALSFALSDKLSLNRTELNSCLHRGMDIAHDKDVEVEVVLKERQNETVRVGKVWRQDLSEELMVNERPVSRKEYETYIESLRISYGNPYNIIQQGKINQIILMDEFELYKLLEEITGAKKFHKRRDEALLTMKKAAGEKAEVGLLLRDLSDKLHSLENRKEEFDFIAAEEKTKKYRIRRQLDEVLGATQANITRAGHEYREISEQLAKVCMKKKGLERRIEEDSIYLRVTNHRISDLDRQSEIMKKTANTQLNSEDFRSLKKELKAIAREIHEANKLMPGREEELKALKDDLSHFEKRYDEMKLGNEFQKNHKNRDGFFQALEKELEYEEGQLKNFRKEKDTLRKKAKQLDGFLGDRKNKQKTENLSQLRASRESLKAQKQEISKKLAHAVWNKNLIMMDFESMKEVESQSQMKLRKVLPHLDFALLRQAQRQKIRGVYGFLIEFVSIDENVAFAYEMAGLSKLCCLLVEDEEACLEVIELNRKVKGRQINIIQLDYLRSQPTEKKPFPKDKEVKSLLNKKWIHAAVPKHLPNHDPVAEDVDKLIANTFGKHALVKDYTTGLGVAKEYHLNCITAQRQIVYADGFLCKLGKEQAFTESRLDIFARFSQKREKVSEQLQKKDQVESEILCLQNEEVGLYNKMMKVEQELNGLAGFSAECESKTKLHQNLSRDMGALEDRMQRTEKSIGSKRENLHNLQDAKKSKAYLLSEEECQQIEGQYNSKRKELNSKMAEAFEIEEQLDMLSKQQKAMHEKIMEKEKGMGGESVVGVESIREGLQQKEAQISEMEADVAELERGEGELLGEQNHMEIKLETYQAEEKDILKQIEELGEISHEEIEDLQEMSNSLSLSHISAKRKHHYSAKDKMLFTKFGSILESFSEHKKTYGGLEEAEGKTLGLVEEFERDAQRYMEKVGEKFEGEFGHIFSQISGRGWSEVRFKKVSEKVRESIRYRNCLMIRVGFGEGPDTMKKWGDFSGGEKTVIAISIILALQRCQPAPFYILDEIDSALDSVYLQRIARLLAEESERNGGQYLITSFKEDMLRFPESLCNYYLVRNRDRASALERIPQEQALQALQSMVREA